jgi:hypothetical protein
MIIFKRIIFILIAISSAGFTSLRGQTPAIDGLKQSLSAQGNDQLVTLLELCKQGSSLPSDSFMRYARMAKQISDSKNDFASSLLADFYIGKCYVFEGKADSGLVISETAMKATRDKGNYYAVYHQLWWLKISCLTKLQKFDETFAESYKMLESGEKYSDLGAQILASNAIGSAYFNFSSDFGNAI